MSIEQNLGYFFFDKNHLKRALRHPSHAEADVLPEPPFQQVPYGVLGRSLLGAIVAEFAVRSGCETVEDMAGHSTIILDQQRLSQMQLDLCLDFYLKVGPAERDAGLHQDAAALQETLMALFGAIYLDGGYSSLRRVVKRFLVDPALGHTEAG
ncbi:MAG: hypothetical protein ACO331_13300 [Prochlorothrix sp.]